MTERACKTIGVQLLILLAILKYQKQMDSLFIIIQLVQQCQILRVFGYSIFCLFYLLRYNTSSPSIDTVENKFCVYINKRITLPDGTIVNTTEAHGYNDYYAYKQYISSRCSSGQFAFVRQIIAIVTTKLV